MLLITYPCNVADANGSQRKAQHAAARLRTKQYCDIATLAWESKLEGVVREACPLALAIVWSAEVDPEVVRWQAEVRMTPQVTSHAPTCSCTQITQTESDQGLSLHCCKPLIHETEGFVTW